MQNVDSLLVSNNVTTSKQQQYSLLLPVSGLFVCKTSLPGWRSIINTSSVVVPQAVGAGVMIEITGGLRACQRWRDVASTGIYDVVGKS